MGLVLLATALPAAAAKRYEILYVGGSGDMALAGARQGLDEANLQGRFLGSEYHLTAIEPGQAAGLTRRDFVAVLAATDAGVLKLLAGQFEHTPVFNLTSDDDELRFKCLTNLLHIAASAAMKADAVAQWRSLHKDAIVSAVAWHSQFMKYAGRDLNKRFTAAFNMPMDATAWAGWAAIRITAEALARDPDATGAGVLARLRDGMTFDGQKGVEMSFRPNGQLRQPLLLIGDGKIVGEAPVRGLADEDDLDSLGHTTCTP